MTSPATTMPAAGSRATSAGQQGQQGRQHAPELQAAEEQATQRRAAQGRTAQGRAADPERAQAMPLASQPWPGYAFLRVPQGAGAGGVAAGTDTPPGTGSGAAASSNPKGNTAGPGTDGAQKPRQADVPLRPGRRRGVGVDLATIGRWIVLWLEAKEGRRAPMALRRGPYSPAVIEGLRRSEPPTVGGARLLRVHAQLTRFGKIRFCASVVYDGRVRAIAGMLDNGKGRRGSNSPRRSRGELRAGLWRVENIHMI